MPISAGSRSKKLEQGIEVLRALVRVDVQEQMGPEVVLDVWLGVLQVLPFYGPDTGERARKDRLE